MKRNFVSVSEKMSRAIISILRPEKSGMNVPDFSSKMPNYGYTAKTYYQSLLTLIERGDVMRTGKGGRADPFYYYYCGEL